MKVVVTGAGALLGQGLIRCLRGSPSSPTVIAVDPSPLSVGLYWADRRYLIPFANDPNFLDEVGAVLEAEEPDVLLVGTDAELAVFADARLDLQERYGTQVIVSPPQVIEVATDKYKTAMFLKRHGFPAPESRLAADATELVTLLGFPLVVKPRIGARSRDMHVVRNREQLTHAIGNRDDMVIQEHVGSIDHEYTAGTICFNGECLSSIVMRRDLRNGNTYRAFVDTYSELNDFVSQVAQQLNAFGPANFQFRLDGDVPKIFEINPRFSGTTPLRRYAGVDEVDIVLRWLTSAERPLEPHIEAVTILRHMSETVVSASDIRAVSRPPQRPRAPLRDPG